MPTTERSLGAGADLFLRLGCHGATMDIVAASADRTKTAVEYHLMDKPALVCEAFAGVFANAEGATRRHLAADGTLRERLTTLAEVVAGLPDPFIRVEVLWREARDGLGAAQPLCIRTAEDAVGQCVIQARREGLDHDGLRDTDPVRVGHADLAPMHLGHTHGPGGQPRFPDSRRTARIPAEVLRHSVAQAGNAPV